MRYQRYVRAAARAALEAGVLVRRFAGRPKSIRTKLTVIDLVTEVDRASERLIRRALHRAEPAFGFLGEEGGAVRPGASGRWIVDPVDGTSNFVHGLPLFGVSIGLELEGRLVAGVIYDPTRRELFTATRSGGAFLNGARLRVSPVGRLSRSLLSTGFSAQFLEYTEPYLSWFKAFHRRSHGVRRIGSTVISLSAIAAGRMDGFYERDLKPWDMAAGILLVQEAGGRTTNLAGGPVVLEEGGLVASNGRIHRAMLAVLRQRRSSRVRTSR